jgi:hypothetical protein
METTTDLLIARRLMIFQEEMRLKQQGKDVKTKSAKEMMEEEASLLNAGTTGQNSSTYTADTTHQNETIKLADLVDRLHTNPTDSGPGVDQANGQTNTGATLTVQRQQIEIELNLQYGPNTPVQGLVQRNQQVAETDRYLFYFKSGTEFTILDKWANKSTTIWGDPHVDVSDVEGQNDGDFKDLAASDAQTTMLLADGSRVTFSARDAGIIESVDIFKGDQHLRGIGAGSMQWDGSQNAMFSSSVDQNSAAVTSHVPTGDVVKVGGDGNDWFNAAGQLVWGKTTSTAPITRPQSVLQIYMKQTITTETLQQTINTQK